MAKMIVEFVGPPGSGKTTLYERIADRFPGRKVPAEEVNEYRLRLFGIPLRTGFRRNDKNIQRAWKVSALYKKSDPETDMLVEKGIYSLLYVMHVRDQRLRARLTFNLMEKPTHLIALVRPGKKRGPRDVTGEEKYGYDRKIESFYDTFIKDLESQGVKILVLDSYASVEEDFEKVMNFLDKDRRQ